MLFTFQRDDRMAYKLTYFSNDDTYTKLTLLYITIRCWNVWTLNIMNQPIKIHLKSPKLLSKRIKKRFIKTLGTSLINSQMSILSLFFAQKCAKWLHIQQYFCCITSQGSVQKIDGQTVQQIHKWTSLIHFWYLKVKPYIVLKAK